MLNLPQPIKDLGNATLTKVAGKFVDFVITKYTGKSIKVFEAEGDVEADKVKTKWEVLEKPFWLQAEAAKMNRQYSNMGNILSKATPFITRDSNTIADDNDVFWGFLEHSKEISNEEMQELIAKIIAGEYNAPGTYSMSALQIIKMLGKNELELFEKVCGLLINNEQLPKVLFTGQENVKTLIQKVGVDFGKLQILQSIGLFLPNDMVLTIPNPEKKKFAVKYFNKTLLYEPENNNLEIKTPDYYGLSVAGTQILKHLTPKYVEGYYVWLKENYKITSYKLTE
ncbi:MAG: DUF2806 domain-containing protein [Candidatus Brocadiaceae bacterium]|nr:DUF2806 domain-containing protein [Candidatus Brocadiaceae bacterium]